MRAFNEFNNSGNNSVLDAQEAPQPVADHDWLIIREQQSEEAPDEQAKTDYDTPSYYTEETAIGQLTVVKQDISLLPFDAHDLADLLARNDRRKLIRLEPRESCSIVSIPGKDGIVLRWNTANEKGSEMIPGTYQELVEYTDTYEQELVRLAQYGGTRILNRNTFVVENDRHNGGHPTIYTATERHSTSRPLTSFNAFYTMHHAITSDIDVHLGHCDTSSQYFIDTPPDEPFIYDNLVYPHQYAGPTLLDYDTYLQSAEAKRLHQLSKIVRWLQRLPDSEIRQQLMGRIGDALNDSRETIGLIPKDASEWE